MTLSTVMSEKSTSFNCYEFEESQFQISLKHENSLIIPSQSLQIFRVNTVTLSETYIYNHQTLKTHHLKQLFLCNKSKSNLIECKCLFSSSYMYDGGIVMCMVIWVILAENPDTPLNDYALILCMHRPQNLYARLLISRK